MLGQAIVELHNHACVVNSQPAGASPQIGSESTRDAPSAPDIATEAKGLSPTRQQFGQLTQLYRGQPRRRTWRWSLAQRGHTPASARTDPLAHSAFGHFQRRRNLALPSAILLEIPSAPPPRFAPILAYPTSLAMIETAARHGPASRLSLESRPETFR
jgi:hypothetical protein